MKHLPLNALVLAPGTSVEPTDGHVVTLAEKILVHGIRAELLVSLERDAEDQPTGRYTVGADAHTLCALQRLAVEGKIFPDLPVQCRQL